MISVAPQLTNAGWDLLTRGVSGEKITFTVMRIGNGQIGDTDQDTLLTLINPLLEIPIGSIQASEEGYVEISGSFDSDDIADDFHWRELGIFAKGEDGTEVLYAYSNDGANASILRAGGGDVVVEQNISVVIAIGEAQNVTAVITTSTSYVSKMDFDAHTDNENNPHKVTAQQVGLGKVPNVATNDQTPTWTLPTSAETVELTSGEKLSIALGKIALAIKNLIAHISNQQNPHKVTAELAGAAAKSHQHSANDISSGTLSMQRGGTGVSGTTAKEVRDGLGAAAKSQGVVLTVAASTWTGDGPYTAGVTCAIATASNHLDVGIGGALTEDQFAAIAAAMIVCTSQGEGNIILTAFGAKPEIDIPVNVREVGS